MKRQNPSKKKMEEQSPPKKLKGEKNETEKTKRQQKDRNNNNSNIESTSTGSIVAICDNGWQLRSCCNQKINKITKKKNGHGQRKRLLVSDSLKNMARTITKSKDISETRAFRPPLKSLDHAFQTIASKRRKRNPKTRVSGPHRCSRTSVAPPQDPKIGCGKILCQKLLRSCFYHASDIFRWQNPSE